MKGDTYLEFVLVDVVLVALATSEEQKGSSDLLALGSESSTFLDETTEGSDTSSRTNHDDGLGRIRRQLEVGVADVNRNVNSVVLVARAGDGVGQTVGIGLRVTILLLLQGQEVVGGNTLDHVRGTGQANRLDDSGDADLILLDQGG
jgi:hypothetical protein